MAGFWVPDLRDGGNLEVLRGWNGEWTSLSRLGFLRIRRDGGWSGSSFPPKGES